MRVAVVGHVEWVTFIPVDAPPTPGSILHATPGWEEPAGGGGVAAVELARLAGRCRLYTGLGDDAIGRRIPVTLAALGVEVQANTTSGPHRRALTLVDPGAERTIVVVGPAQEAAGLRGKDFEGVDAVYFCKGDAASVRAARSARVLVATARVLPVLAEAGVELDALVLSSSDPSERYAPTDLPIAPRLIARTDGARGGAWQTAERQGRWRAAPLPGPAVDTYGAGDSFAAGLAWALCHGHHVQAALDMAAAGGALALTRRGAHGPP